MFTPLLTIIAHARSGALDYAWRLYREAGLDRVQDDPRVLAVRGRLLKDRAAASPPGPERKGFYIDAAKAYSQAAVIEDARPDGSPGYPLINAATLWLLGGHPGEAAALADQVLELPARGKAGRDTPYFIAATQAEALLLRGRVAEARSTFTDAIARQPRAWEDHATTLRQFGLILAALGEDAGWLDAHRPPRALHFAGHMAVGGADAALAARVRELVAAENIGFGFGALAAGADIVIAEALLEAGAEVHPVLPAPPAAFREGSVAGFGGEWAARFENVLDQAEPVRVAGCPAESPCPLSIRLAAEVAMGAAVMQAKVLMTEAVQLLIVDGDAADDGASAWVRAMWDRTGRRQHLLAAPRTRRRAAPPMPKDDAPPPAALAAMLVIAADAEGAEGAARLAADVLPAIAAALAEGPQPSLAPRCASETVLVGYAACAEAADASRAISAALGPDAGIRIAGHYGVVRTLDDPFGGPALAVGWSARLPLEILASVPPGAIHLSEDFAAALHGETPPGQARTELIGELPRQPAESPVRLYSLKP